MKRMQGHGCWKASSQWEKCLMQFLRVKAQVHKIYFLWNEMLFAMQKTGFHVLELFAEQVMLELQCTESIVYSFKNTNAVLVQLSKWRECKTTDAEKASFSERESC